MAIAPKDCIPIPQPPGYPLVGNITDIDPEVPTTSLQNLARQYGEIYSVTRFGRRSIFVSTQALVEELCDEKRFGKVVKGALAEVRHGVHDGLFTAHNEEENWALAHRILVPAFGPLNLNTMFDDMKDIASQLILKWARHGPENVIHTTDDFTRLTLDTLALCTMGYRFNSYYSAEMHPFISAMGRFLRESGARAVRPSVLSSFYRAQDAQFKEDIQSMRRLSDEIIEARLRNPNDSKDLVNAMIKGRDPKTGKSLSKSNIIDQMITFMIAGHETTSGTLSFLMYYLLKNPEAYRKVQEEVDTVLGHGTIELEHLKKLTYIPACLRETLRLQPPAPVISLSPHKGEGETLGGKYHVPHDESVGIIIAALHRDPAVYGDDAEEFKPERMLDEKFNALPPHSWKPFGNGMRACIGRPFAWQEMLICVSMLFQYFNFSAENDQYNLQLKSTLTIKPKDFYLRATIRDHWDAQSIERSLAGSLRGEKPAKEQGSGVQTTGTGGVPFTILYGSNSGTCESLAQTLAADAASHGFKATQVATLDSARQSLPTDQPVVIITASYEGQPCDNAAHFYDWLQNLKQDEKLPVQYVVFGCGHSDWKQTFHRIPKSIDTILGQHGGQKICEMGYADAAKNDIMSAFQTWEDETFWQAMQHRFKNTANEDQVSSLAQGLNVSVSTPRGSHLRADVSQAKVVAVKTLTAPGVPIKKQIEFQLPSGMTYRAGDYLAVLPVNLPSTVHRVAVRFGLPWDAVLTIESKTGTSLPTDRPISANDLFANYVELGQPATKRNVSMLIDATLDETTQQELKDILDGDFASTTTNKRISLLDLLERYPLIELPLSAFITSLITMRVRQYSISSSPLNDPQRVALTYAVLDADAYSGQGRHAGVASNYLSSLHIGDIAHVAVKPSHPAFHLPPDPGSTPVLMIAAGTGLAPFRSFIQERAAMTSAGRKLAPALLFFGCRDPEKDNLYADEMRQWEDEGVVTVHRAFSQSPAQSHGHAHIDQVLRAHAAEVTSLWARGARVYVCGSRGLGESVKTACMEIARAERMREGVEVDDERLEDWFNGLRNERYSTDVFA